MFAQLIFFSRTEKEEEKLNERVGRGNAGGATTLGLSFTFVPFLVVSRARFFFSWAIFEGNCFTLPPKKIVLLGDAHSFAIFGKLEMRGRKRGANVSRRRDNKAFSPLFILKIFGLARL